MIRINAGCGANIKEGWHNLDIEPNHGVTVCDLTKMLPFSNASVDVVFSEHAIEHFTFEQGAAMFREFARVLRPGGYLRVATPDLRVLAYHYLRGELQWAESVGWLPVTACQMLNGGLRMWGHQHVYDEDELKMLFASVGFTAKRVKPRESEHEALRGLECRPDLDDLVLEAVKQS